jgi:hypothetical protein
MGPEEKQRGRDMVHAAILKLYEREVKDEWAELEEVE